MSAHTKTHPTNLPKRKASRLKKQRGIPWREAFKADIEKYTEAGIMIRGSRYKEGLTQKELAKILGILPHHISEMEHGKRAVSKKMAHKLAKALNVGYKVFL